MLRRLNRGFLVVVLLLLSRPLAAAETALDAVSSEAALVVRMKNPKTTVDKVADLVDEVAEGQGDQVRAQINGLGLLISNPGLAGVNMEADWWLAVYTPGGQQDPEIVFIIPASDAEAMKAAVTVNAGQGEEDEGDSKQAMKFLTHGSFGVYTDDSGAAEKTEARLKGEGDAISKIIEEQSTAVFDRGDISVFINVPRLVTAYRDQIDQVKQQIEQAIANMPAEVPNAPPGFDPKVMSELVNKLVAAILQGLDDAKSCTIAAMVAKEGLSFEDLVRVTKGSETDKYFAKMTPDALSLLAKLPAGSLGYFGARFDMSELIKLGMSFAGGAFGQTGEAGEELKSALEEISKLKFGAMAGSFSLGDLEKGAIQSVSITEVSDPAKMRAVTQKMYKAMGEVEAAGIKQEYKYEADAEKYGKRSADVLTVKVEAEGVDDPAAGAMMSRFFETLYGPDGMVTRSVYLQDRVVQTMGGGKDAMTQALAAIDQKTPATNAPVQKTRAQLSEKANLLVLFDLPGTLSRALQLVVESGMLPPFFPIDAQMVQNLEIPRSYLGLSVVTEPQGLRVKTAIPVEQAQGIAKLVGLFAAMQAAPVIEEDADF